MDCGMWRICKKKCAWRSAMTVLALEGGSNIDIVLVKIIENKSIRSTMKELKNI
jgi:hypothetical protein